MYDIKTTNDVVKGAGHTVSIPETDVDYKALYTLQHDRPDFVLPFSVRFVDGVCELTYRLGSMSKLAYMTGRRNPGDYVDIWMALLKPLVECGDWFMKPYSFAFDFDYLYSDNNGKTLSFIYIPSLGDYCGKDGMQSTLVKFANQISVDDTPLENKLLRAIQNFNPKAVLDVLTTHKSPGSPAETRPAPALEQPAHEVPRVEPQVKETVKPATPKQQAPAVKSDQIAIHFGPKNQIKNTKEKPPKPEKKKKKRGFWPFRKAEPKPAEIIGGSAVSFFEEAVPDTQQSAQVDTSQYDSFFGEDENTIIEDNYKGFPKLSYKGTEAHPKKIDVRIDMGAVLSIGRHDPTSGVRQSDYEFDQKTKGVSRRHAVIERSGEGYFVVDLNSAAGTYVNGKLITPGAAVKLLNGDRVSFGNLGADYIWEGR